MTIRELIELLLREDPDCKVVIFKPGCISPSYVTGVDALGSSVEVEIQYNDSIH